VTILALSLSLVPVIPRTASVTEKVNLIKNNALRFSLHLLSETFPLGQTSSGSPRPRVKCPLQPELPLVDRVESNLAYSSLADRTNSANYTDRAATACPRS
jgi:hypothetical protein